jgi:hypothetical protein
MVCLSRDHTKLFDDQMPEPISCFSKQCSKAQVQAIDSFNRQKLHTNGCTHLNALSGRYQSAGSGIDAKRNDVV